ncbi:MAG: tetratricopeptide repeat protein, partial [Planctomycetaceae bacterium]|nr:tetratricopeptide repeat protein [Planctomycetaceae bacterium]
MKHRRLFLSLPIVLATAMATAQFSQAADVDAKVAKRPAVTSLPRVSPAVQNALAGSEFAKAIELIDAQLKKDDVVAPDYLLYLRGRAQTELRTFDDALLTFETLKKRYPNSVWISRARFGQADVFARQRNYRKAGEIYRAEAERLLSRGRKDKLAAIYLEFAHRYFKGIPAKDPSAKPDYTQALAYYQEALKLEPSLAVRHDVEPRIGRCFHELGKHGEAIAAYRSYLARYADEKTKADDRTPANTEVEVRFQLGRSQLTAGQNAEARKTWQDLVQQKPEFLKKPGFAAAERIAVATYQIARTFGMPAPGTIGDLELGVTALESFLKAYPKHKLAPQAEFDIAQGYAHHGRYDQAIAQLQTLIGNKTHAETKQVADARKLLGDSYFAQKNFTEAIAAWREFLDKHPTNAGWANVQRLVINSEFQMGEEQRRQKNYAAARKQWETFLNKYPLDSRAAHLLLRFGEMNYAAAAAEQRKELEGKQPDDDTPDSRRVTPAAQKLFDLAIADWTRLVSKYPGSNEASRAAYLIGVTLEDRLGRLPDALEAYRKVAGASQPAAQKRIAGLTSHRLEVVTDRKYRTNERAKITLRTRNLEKVTVAVYRIDMIDYFRKMHLADGIESLDIALIDPDKSWEYTVDGYEKYRQLTNEIEIPLEGPGVSAVTVTGDNLEATTMVIVSDIDVIVKSSRNELFVFAENMLTGKPVQGVSLLVSDGSKVFAEELTNKDGIVQHVGDELKTVSDLRVFAIHEGHAASSVTSLSGLDFAVGLAPKGYLYSDRPAYRAGQLVHLKGVIRWVDGDRFVFKEGEQYSLDVYDSRGRVIHTQKTKLSKWGTFAENFALPDTAPQGDYRVHLHQAADKPSYETSFQIHDYKLEPIQLAVELPRKVFYRGENITGTISLKYYYGTPLADRTIQYQLADDRLHTATTDNKGEVTFEFETRRFSESQSLGLNVTFPERNLRTAETIQLATRGLDIGVSTLRSVYIAGETFDATFNVADAAGKPAGSDLTLDVLEQTRVDGKRGERSIQAFEIKSDDKTGEARQTLRIDKSGRYIVRATATDRFGNRVSGQKTVIISGEDDTIRLRILAEKHHYQLGDTAKVQLHWREDPALALVTFEGAKILGYRLVQLKTGANPLEIPLESQLAPNFRLSVAVMQGDRFHQANSEFRIERQLNIALKPNKTTLGPGEELKVDITVTDPQGKPVSAELSLGLIQKNLLDYFGDRAGLIDEYFGSGYRRPSVRATTSCTFRYLPKTRGVNEFLLAEAERESIEAAETAATENLARAAVDIRPGNANAVAVNRGGAKVIAAAMLEDARRALQAGDVKRASELAERAKAFGVSWGLFEDRPDQVLAALNSHTIRNRTRSDLPIPVGSLRLDQESRLAELVSQYNQAFAKRRYAEAEVLAKQAEELDPDNQAVVTMRWKARFARRNQRINDSLDAAEDARVNVNHDLDDEWGIVVITDGLPNSRAFTADGRQNTLDGIRIAGPVRSGRSNSGNDNYPMGGTIVGLSAPGQFDANSRNGDGTRGDVDFDSLIGLIQQETSNGTGGTIAEYEATLSLVIREDQSIDPQVTAQFFDDLANIKSTIVAVNNAGNFQVINGLNEGQLKAFGKDGMRVLPQMGTAETGYWNPVVVTGDDGKTTVSFRLPDRSTAWTLQSRGINAETLSGQAEVEIIARKDLFGSLKTPLAFAQGDKAQLLAEVHNAVIKQGEKILVKLKATNGDKSTEQKRTVISKGPGIAEVTFPIDIADGSQVDFELTVTSGEQSDVSRTVIPIRPFGLPVYATSGGSAAQNTIAFVGHDEKLAVEDRHLEIVIGPSVNRTLLDAVLGSGLTAFDSSAYLPRSGLERTVSDVIGGIGLLKMTGGSRTADTPEAQALSGRIQTAIGQLVSAQRDDGGWSWGGRPAASKSDRYLSSRMVWALSSARGAGYAVPTNTFDKAVQFLRTAFTATNPADREAQAIILHGLAEAGAADFAFANRLYRERNNLSPSGLLHVALVLAKLDRKQMAGELLQLVKIPIDADMANGSKVDSAMRGCIPWMQTGVELRALYLLALEDVAPTDAKAAKLADWLLAARRGTRWTPEKANGPAIAALADWFSRTKQTGEKYTLSVFVNDRLVEKIAVDPSTDGSRR